MTSLDKLSKTFLKDKPLFQKDTENGKILINQLLNKTQDEINLKLQDKNFITKFENYCLQDCVSLWYIIDIFNNLIFG